MTSLHGPRPKSSEQLAPQLEHPNSQAIWSRALEVFGDESKARTWHTPMLYTSQHLSLACLEILVHLDLWGQLPDDYAWPKIFAGE